jgi:hypothetical protein
LDGVENNVEKRGVRCWRKIARGGNAWKLILKETKSLHTEGRASGEEEKEETFKVRKC